MNVDRAVSWRVAFFHLPHAASQATAVATTDSPSTQATLSALLSVADAQGYTRSDHARLALDRFTDSGGATRR